MKLLKTAPYITLLFLLIFVCCDTKSEKADLIFINAKIWTGNKKQPLAEAMAISADTILAIGNTEQILKHTANSTKIVDIKSAFISPGFIDTHVHLMMGGNALLSVRLNDANTPKEFIKRINKHTKTLKPNQWVLEGNWDHTLWGGELPNKKWIDADTPNNPVAIYRLDGHMILANSVALKLAGIDKNTPEISSGKIIRNPDGTPTGILKGHAMNLVLNKIPPMSEPHKIKSLNAATQYLLSNGVTSVHDVDSLGTYSAAKKLKEQNKLAIRLYLAKPLNRYNQAFNMSNEHNKWLKTGLVKGFVDGSLGSHTAAFHEPYSDQPQDKGYFITNEEKLYTDIYEADKANLQITVHAIGDRAIHSLLNLYEQLIKEHEKKDRRLRIEHAQHLAVNDIKRFKELGVIASMQPYHAIDDGRWAETLIGTTRMQNTYAFKSLLNANAKLVFGSDWPVAPATPLEGIYAAVTRRTLDNKNPDGWVPQQKITVVEALRAYTKDAAYASFDEKTKGTLEKGKLADFVILNEDITTIDPIKIKNVQILQTYVGGKKRYDHKN